MSAHVIIDTGHLSARDYKRYPGCAVCGLSADMCEEMPHCSKASEGRYSIAAVDQKSAARRRKAMKR